MTIWARQLPVKERQGYGFNFDPEPHATATERYRSLRGRKARRLRAWSRGATLPTSRNLDHQARQLLAELGLSPKLITDGMHQQMRTIENLRRRADIAKSATTDSPHDSLPDWERALLESPVLGDSLEHPVTDWLASEELPDYW